MGRSDSGYILKVELMRFADGLDMGCESHGPIPVLWEGLCSDR